jgi:hypothetical protein
VVTITAHVEAGSPRTSITTLVTEELLNRLSRKGGGAS